MYIWLFCPIIQTFSTIKVFVGRRDAILHTHLNKKHYLGLIQRNKHLCTNQESEFIGTPKSINYET